MPDQRTEPNPMSIRPDAIQQWWPSVYPDLPWLMVEVENLRRAGIDRDPTVELVLSHPAFPADLNGALWGLRAVQGRLGVRVEHRE